MLFGHLYVFFGEMSVYIFSTFFDWVVCFFDIDLHELFYVLEINLLSIASFANIFSHSVGCLFILFMVSLLCRSF